jgi:hypothetical protein
MLFIHFGCLQEDQVWCFCGDDDPNYAGVWVQCESCKRWQHTACVGYVPSGPKQYVALSSSHRGSCRVLCRVSCVRWSAEHS